MILPRHPYELDTSEFFRAGGGGNLQRRDEPVSFIPSAPWNARRAVREGYYLRFNAMKGEEEKEGEERPMPWKIRSLEKKWEPACVVRPDNDQDGKDEGWDCTDRNVWRDVHEAFRERRMEVCGLDLEP